MATEQFTEEWRPIRDLPYEVSSHGRVRRSAGGHATYIGRLLSGGVCRGYRYVSLCVGTRSKMRPVHQLVAEAFLGSRPTGKVVNHKDGDRQNNFVTNLEWVTPSENLQHAHDTGLIHPARGERHHNAKLTSENVVAMREAYLSGESALSISKRFAVSHSNAWLIVNGKSWRII